MAIRKSYRKQLIAKIRTKNEQALVVVGRQAVGFVKAIMTEKNIVDTGNLRASIVSATSMKAETPGTVGGKKGAKIALPGVKLEQPDEGHVVIGTNVSYAAHIEFGTRHGHTGRFTESRPFLRPGVLNNKKALGATYAKMMKGL